jgi:hypothetical protein
VQRGKEGKRGKGACKMRGECDKLPATGPYFVKGLLSCHVHACNNQTMQTLRNAKLIARCVLLWFALSMGVAIASPLVKPQDLRLVCSAAGAVKLVLAVDDGQAAASSHTLDCPLCASIGAPPPMDMVVFGVSQPAAFVSPAVFAEVPRENLAAPPPARGPPALS